MPETTAIWSLTQVNQARGLYGRVFLDQEMLARWPDDSREVIRDKMWRKVRDMGHPFGIEIQPQDLEFREVEADNFRIEVTCRWNPPTREAEMRGGPHDGEVLTFHDAGSHLPFYFPARVDPMSAFTDPDPAVLPSIKIAYNLGGWDESRHRWVYDYDGPV